MSSLGSAVGQMLDWVSGDEGKNVVEMLVKNPELQKRLDAGLGDYDKTRTASSKALDQYIKDYLAGGKTATARSNQEQSELDRYYNGDVERQLASLRTRTAAANDQALNRSLAYMRRNMSANQIGGGGSTSYDRQLALKTGSDMALSSLLSGLAQERADADYLNRMKLGLTGQRTAMADALAARGLVPSQAMKGELGWNLGSLRDLLALDQANKFYGVKYDPSWGEEVGQHVGDLANAAMQAFSIYSGGGLGGMMGGGGGTGSTGGWSPGSSPMMSGSIPNWAQGESNTWGYPGSGWGALTSSSAPSIPSFGNTWSSIPYGWGGVR